MIATLFCLALASAQEPSAATDHAERGLKAYEEHRYDDAAAAFGEAFAADPNPQYVYAQANALRMAGECGDAIPRYREFLATGPTGKTESAARQNLEECEASVAAERQNEPEPTPTPVVAPVATPPPPTPEIRDRSVLVRDPWAHALTWPGLAVAGIGAGLLAEAHFRRARADRAVTELEYRDALSGAPSLSQAGIGLLTAGSALVVAGVVRWSILAAKQRRDRGRAHRWRSSFAAIGVAAPLAIDGARGVP